MIINLAAVQRQAGLEMMLGSPALAYHMGQAEDIASRVGKPTEGLVCEHCANSHGLAQFVECLPDKGNT